MEADAAEPGPIQEGAEVAIEVRGIERPARQRGEDEAVVLPSFRCRLTFCFLTLMVFFQRVDALSREGDAPFGCAGFGGQAGQPAGLGALESAADAGSAGAEVYVLPLKAEDLALAEPVRRASSYSVCRRSLRAASRN